MNQNGQKWPKWPKVTPKWQVEKLFWQVDKLSIMECEEFIFSDWSPPDNPIQSECANSWIMECEEFILPDWSRWRTGHLPEWSSPDDPAMVFAAVGRLNPIHYFFFKRNGHLPDWSSPDDPARFLAAVGRLKPSLYKVLQMVMKVSWSRCSGMPFLWTCEHNCSHWGKISTPCSSL